MDKLQRNNSYAATSAGSFGQVMNIIQNTGVQHGFEVQFKMRKLHINDTLFVCLVRCHSVHFATVKGMNKSWFMLGKLKSTVSYRQGYLVCNS